VERSLHLNPPGGGAGGGGRDGGTAPEDEGLMFIITRRMVQACGAGIIITAYSRSIFDKNSLYQ